MAGAEQHLSRMEAPCDSSSFVASTAKSALQGSAARQAAMCSGGDPSQRDVTLLGLASSRALTTSR